MITIDQLNEITIDKLLSLDIPNYEIYFKLSKTKVIKYAKSMEDNRDSLEVLKSRGVSEVYLSKKEYRRFMKDQITLNKDRIQTEKKNRETTLSDSLDSLDSAHEMITNAVIKLGLDKNTLNLVEELNTDTFNFINQVKDFRILLKNFQKNSKKGFAKNLLASYFVTNMTKNFKWANKGKMLERLSLGVFLANLGLKDEDLELIKNNKVIKKLPDHIVKNSSNLISFLEKNNKKLHEDVRFLIEQHHEKPDGKGFPRGLQARQINLYAAIYIIAYEFSELLFETNFSFEDINKSFFKIKSKYSFYIKLNNNFTRSFEAFEKMCRGIGIDTESEYEVDNE